MPTVAIKTKAVRVRTSAIKLRYIQGGFFYWYALKNYIVNPVKKVLSVRISGT